MTTKKAQFKKYRRRPVEVEAIQWVVRQTPSDDAKPIVDLINSLGGEAEFVYDYDSQYQYAPTIKIKTLEGVMTAHVGYYICRGLAGEFWGVRPDVFEKTNEPVEENTTQVQISGPGSISIQAEGDVVIKGVN